jgi:tripartite-type tricarboxylate transporter receptor subunit TctC
MPARRQFLQLAAGAAAFPALARIASAQSYPSWPVKLVVPYTPAGVTDILARLIGQWLTERLGQSFVVENRPGASTSLGTEAVVRAAADGYTLLLVSPANAVNATLYEKLSYNFIRDIAPVASIGRGPNVMVINPGTPARTVPEFIAYAKANPGGINMASPGAGSSQHLSGELFKMMAGVAMTHVPYRGGAPALTDLIGGRIQVYFAATASSMEYIRAGKVRALAVTTTTRSPALPDVPAMGEFLPGYEASAFYGIGAPAGTPAEIVDRLNREVNAGLADGGIASRLADLGIAPAEMTPTEFGKLIADETAKWASVVRFAGVKPE